MHKYFLIILSMISIHAYAMEISQDPLFIQKLKLLEYNLKKSNDIRLKNELNTTIISKINPKTGVRNYYKQRSKRYIEPLKPDYIFGSKIIDKKLSFQEKKYCINQLITNNYAIHPEEKKLAYLDWWRRVPFNKMILISCAAKKDRTIFSVVPYEVISFIALNMAHATESLEPLLENNYL